LTIISKRGLIELTSQFILNGQYIVRSGIMNFLKVARRDVSNIFRNRFIRVSVIAIIIVPLLYSLLYLAAFWDPYSRLDKMPVAVVNLDKGALKDGATVSYGKDLVDKLKSNEKVGWDFVSKEAADAGVKGKKYYAEFVITEDFSKKILSAKDGKPDQAKILYSANEKRNFLAAQINGKVLVELKAEIVKGITEEYTKVTFDSMYEVKDGMKQAADGSKTLADGLTAASSGSLMLSDGLKSAGSGVEALYFGADKINGGLKQLNDASKPAFDGINKLNEGLTKTILPSMGKLTTGASSLSTGLQGAAGGASQLSTAATSLKNGSDKLQASVEPLKAGAAKLTDGYKQLAPSLASLKTGSEQVSAGVNEFIGSVTTAETTLKTAADTKLHAYLVAHPEAMADPNMQGFLSALQGVQTAQQDPANTLKVATLAKGAKDVADGTAALASGTPQFVQGATDFSQGASQFAAGTVQWSQGAVQYSAGATTLATGVAGAIPGSKAISDGLTQLYSGMNGDFRSGLGQINAGSTSISSGIGQLYLGSTTLRDSIASPVEAKNFIATNAKTTSTGTLYNGVSQLSEGAVKVNDGMSKLSTGAAELNTKLTAGSDKINKNLINDSTTMSKFVAAPVAIDESSINPVKNYGTGFTPYFIPLSLWVGALMMFFVITDKVDDDINVGSAALVAGKYLSYGFIGLIQAVLASTVVLFLGLRPANIVLYYIFNIFMSYVFIAIIQCLVFLLGQAGRLLAIVLLILQLTACAGTFPLEVVPPFFKVLNPLMPFTYCVSALRETISGVDYSALSMDFAVLAVVLVVFLTISIVFKEHADKVQSMIQDRKESIA
jgi:putative membrane protein